MIVTVTLNPALDLTYAVDALVPHGTHRVTTVAERPGGKGLNVARVLHALGEPVLATGLLGGTTGGRVAALLRGEGVAASFVDIAGETRRTVAVVDRADATGFWEPGPTITEAEWSRFADHFRGLLREASVVTLSGSLPPGLPASAYAHLIAYAREAGVPTLLDTSGAALRHGLLAGPALAKPNADELAALLAPPESHDRPGHLPPPESHDRPGLLPPPGSHDRADAAGPGAPGPAPTEVGGAAAGLVALVRAVAGGPVVVSRGAAGLLAIAGDEVWECVPPVALDGNPTGAGDACVAALARGLRDRTAWPDLLADAVALSAAAVAVPVAGAFDPETYRRTFAIARPLPSARGGTAEIPGTASGGSRARTHR
ncbi:1-phosphofructokinase family hexose kinase [Paractinoplanes toevensis]|uniref:Sugar kinase n=1 Tax=Paractinoplanes toevensis TaxID=571911 RepID=A0A919TAC4_9ACTN|nr:PfkB family carbohydrate kinase [Actinoplanes toevensis]GIM91612.1 sugar kinase [Actinoplanes toevensis]